MNINQEFKIIKFQFITINKIIRYLKRIYSKQILHKNFLNNLINDFNIINNKINNFNIILLNNDNLDDQFFVYFSDFKKEILNFNFKYILNQFNNCDCSIEIRVISGGFDANNCSNLLIQCYLDILDNLFLKYSIISFSKDNFGNFRNIKINVYGDYAFDFFQYENGIHKFIRKSPFNSSRHTSLILVTILLIKEKEKKNINISDLLFTSCKSSGAGGQHINKTESAIRVVHKPSGLFTKCKKYKSQYQNKKEAIIKISNKLHTLYNNNDILNNVNMIQIRSYILDKLILKDLINNISININSLNFEDIFFLIILNLIFKKKIK